MDDHKRYSKALFVALALHLIMCMIFAILNITVNKRPAQILEVTLAGGPPPKLGAPKTKLKEQPKEKKKAIIPKKDDIVEKKKISFQENTPQLASSVPETSTTSEGVADGLENGTSTESIPTSNNKAQSEKHGVPATPPRVISSYKPPYPASARSSNAEGTTYVKVLVNSNGRVEEAYVASSSGNNILDDVAVNALYKWRFAAAKDSFGHTCSCYITLPITFNIR